MHHFIRSRSLVAAGLLLGGILVAPVSAIAGDGDRARPAEAAAQGRIDAAAQAGATEHAASILEQAKMAAAEAEKLVKKRDNEDASSHKAAQATALADLAIATTELKKLQQERDQLRAGQ